MAGDLGDEFGQWGKKALLAIVSEILREAQRRSRYGNSSAAKGGTGKTNERAVKRSRYDEAEAKFGVVDVANDPHYGYTPDPDKARQMVTDLEDVGCEVKLTGPGIEPVPDDDFVIDGMYRIEIDDPDKLELGSDIRARFEAMSARNAQMVRIASEATKSKYGELSERLKGVDMDNPANLRKFDFETVKWDQNAEMMKEFLDNMGVPHRSQAMRRPAGKNKVVRFEVPSQAAPDVMELANFMSKKIRGMKMERFKFEPGFDEAASAVMQTTHEIPAEMRDAVSRVFEDLNVSHAITPNGSGDYTLQVTATPDEVQRAMSELEKLAPGELEKLGEQTRAAQLEHETQSKGVTKQLQGDFKNGPGRPGRRAKGPEIAKDESLAKKAAEAAKKMGNPIDRFKKTTRGGM